MRNPDTFKLAPAFLDRFGLSPEEVCARAGVRNTDSFTTDEFFRLWEAADVHFRDPSFGLKLGASGIREGFGVAALVAVHAPDFRAAIAALARYKRLTCPELVELERVGEEAKVLYRWTEAAGAVPSLLSDMTIASLCALADQGSGGNIKPVRIELSRSQARLDLLEDHFGCPIILDARHDAVVFAARDLDTRFVTAEREAFARIIDGLEAKLSSSEGHTGLVGDLRIEIARLLNEGQSPTIAATANRLRLSNRTLQRRLQEKATSFQDQLSSVRHTMAGRLLANTNLDTVAIAMLLGFDEPNSFARAFRAWENATPALWRSRQTSAHT